MSDSDPRDAEAVRKRYLYRRLILTRRVALPRVSATRLIGPDCAYHLYRGIPGAPPGEAASDEAGEREAETRRDDV